MPLGGTELGLVLLGDAVQEDSSDGPQGPSHSAHRLGLCRKAEDPEYTSAQLHGWFRDNIAGRMKWQKGTATAEQSDRAQ